MSYEAPSERIVRGCGFLRKERVARKGGIHVTIRRLALLALAFAVAFIGTLPAGASSIPQPPTLDTPPDVPSNLATEYPQPEPVLHATYSDPDGGTGRILYTIYNRSGHVIVRDAAGSTVSSGSDSPYTIACNYSGRSGSRTSGGQRSSPVVKRPAGWSSWTMTFCPAHPVTVPARPCR